MNAFLRNAAALACIVLGWSLGASAAPGNIITVAGGGAIGDGEPALNATLNSPDGIAFDPAGNYYFSQYNDHRIRKVTAAGVITTIAGTGAQGFGGDGGLATNATLKNPRGIAFDSAGNLYFCDEGNHRVRKIDTSGVITTVAGDGVAQFQGDTGLATAASLNAPHAVVVDAGGNLLITDYNNHRVRRVSAGVIDTVAGNGTTGSGGDGGPATSAQLSLPWGIVLDGAGGFYVADTSSARVRHVNAAGAISAFAGTGNFMDPLGDGGPAVNARLGIPAGLARDSVGNVYIVEWTLSNRVRVVDTAGIIHTFAGTGSYSPGSPGDGGLATFAGLANPTAAAVDATGNVYIADTDNNRIRRVDISTGHINTVAGLANSIGSNGDGGPATLSVLTSPKAVAIGAGGVFYIIEQASSTRVRKVDASGTITTAFNQAGFIPSAIALDATGNLYVAGLRVIKVGMDGTITNVAGNGTFGFSGDGGPATAAMLSNPYWMAFDGAGNLYIADLGNNRVRKVDTGGIITTVAGYGFNDFSGDGGPATSAGLNAVGVAVDAAGNLFIADVTNNRVRKVDPAGIITTVAGDGSAAFGGDGGPATSAQLRPFGGLAVDPDGNLYISDKSNRVRVVSPDGTINTISGNGTGGFNGDGGPALAASLFGPQGLAWDPAGNLFIVDAGNLRVRKVAIIDTTPAAFTFGSQTGVALSTLTQSPTVAPTSFVPGTAISVAGGEYSIGCTATFVTAPGTIDPGQTVCVRHVSSDTPNKDVTTTLTIGGVPGTFTTTTAVGPGSVAVGPGAGLDFGGQSMNTTSPAQVVTLTNFGSVPVTVNAVSIAGNYFALTHDCAALAPGAACHVSVTFTPRTQGALAATLRLQPSPGSQTVALNGIGERSLATHYYRSILRRDPDPTGKAFWNSEAARMTGLGANINEAWFAMATFFYFSPEYVGFNRSNADFVTDLYNTFFNRAPDPSGFPFWTGQLANGMPREVVLAGFMFSPEFTRFTQAIFGNTAARAEVDMVMDFYRGILARLPDDAGFNFWVQRFRAAQCNSTVKAEADAISKEFITGSEYLARSRTNGQYVGDLYNAFLRRGGDPSGVQAWISRLDTGTYTREVVRGGFLNSPEFQARVNRVITQGCLP